MATRSHEPAAPSSMVLEAGTAFVRPVGAAINAAYLAAEERCVMELTRIAQVATAQRARITAEARRLVEAVRRNRSHRTGLDAFLKEYDLSSQEGVVLMCLAEALLRIPDDDTADALIAEKVSAGDWGAHLRGGESLFVNASTWGLLLTGRVIRPSETDVRDPHGFVLRLARRLGEPLVRAAFRHAIRVMGHQFVMGRTIEEALGRASQERDGGYRYSFDMLGEAALTAAAAERYLAAYSAAIAAIGAVVPADSPIEAAPSISVKLSALFPRYELGQRQRVLAVLLPRLIELAVAARGAGIGLTVDAEEADRLELSLELIERVCQTRVLAGWNGIGVAVQAYQKRALPVLRWLVELASRTDRRLNIRLVKGAYWDSEIKRAQEHGHAGYPVYTRKANTDVSYIACVRTLLAAGDAVYPQFATHNAQTVATVLELADAAHPFEFQRLHGMGEDLYAVVNDRENFNVPCRVYAPVGSHEDLLPYLVRRLLENGANTSFVNRIIDERIPVDAIVVDPVLKVNALAQKAHPRIPLPRDLFGAHRLNSRGLNFADGAELEALAQGMRSALATRWHAAPVVAGRTLDGEARTLFNPADRTKRIGTVVEAASEAVDAAVDSAVRSQPVWDRIPATERATILAKAADLFEERLPEFVAYCVREAGKTIPDSVAEVREAIDFLRYYAAGARQDFSDGAPLPAPAGETNMLRLQGCGVFVCISPWNFPLAIFTGQIAAALATGNSVIAKPAEQTPLVAARAVECLHEAGVPFDVLHFLPGDGDRIGARAVADPRVAGVAFTGSTETAKRIHRSLAMRPGLIPKLIAETGGQNVMLVDSSALPEQVVLDAVQSGFNSAGQRCSALRVLFLQEEIAARVLELLAGCMEELVIGDPALLSTDIGPVIDEASRTALEQHVAAIGQRAKWRHACSLPATTAPGTFFAPSAVEIESISELTREVFGPIVHIIRYSAGRLDAVIEAINATGYGLTLGIHSRIDATQRRIFTGTRAGNVYVNRNMIGAVVGMQPFGGCGLSGTGPKAGGPYYLRGFANERTLTVNAAAVGGNATLLSLGADEP